MLINTGTQERLVGESTTGAGVTSREGSIKSDSLVATLWVGTITSGTLTVSVYTLTDVGKEVLLFSFPVVSAPTTNLLLKKAGVSLQRFRIVASYTGVCSYEIYVRAVEGAGESSSRILGSNSLATSAASVTTIAAPLIPSTLTDRSGLVIKHWAGAGNVYLSESLAKLPNAAYPLGPKDGLALDIAAGVTIYAVTDAGTADVRIAEAGA